MQRDEDASVQQRLTDSEGARCRDTLLRRQKWLGQIYRQGVAKTPHPQVAETTESTRMVQGDVDMGMRSISDARVERPAEIELDNGTRTRTHLFARTLY